MKSGDASALLAGSVRAYMGLKVSGVKFRVYGLRFWGLGFKV